MLEKLLINRFNDSKLIQEIALSSVKTILIEAIQPYAEQDPAKLIGVLSELFQEPPAIIQEKLAKLSTDISPETPYHNGVRQEGILSKQARKLANIFH